MALKIENHLLAVKQQLEDAELNEFSGGQVAKSGNVSVTLKIKEAKSEGRATLRIGSDNTVEFKTPVVGPHASDTYKAMRQTAMQIIDSNLAIIEDVRQSITKHLAPPSRSHVATLVR